MTTRAALCASQHCESLLVTESLRLARTACVAWRGVAVRCVRCVRALCSLHSAERCLHAMEHRGLAPRARRPPLCAQALTKRHDCPMSGIPHMHPTSARGGW